MQDAMIKEDEAKNQRSFDVPQHTSPTGRVSLEACTPRRCSGSVSAASLMFVQTRLRLPPEAFLSLSGLIPSKGFPWVWLSSCNNLLRVTTSMPLLHLKDLDKQASGTRSLKPCSGPAQTNEQHTVPRKCPWSGTSLFWSFLHTDNFGST